MFNPHKLALCGVWLVIALILGGCGEGPPAAGDNIVRLDADGIVQLGWDATPDGNFRLSESDPLAQDRAPTRLGVALRKIANEQRTADGHSTTVLRLEVAPDAKWLYVQWLLQSAANPEVWIWQLKVRLAGELEWTPLLLPRGAGVIDAGPRIGDVSLGPKYSKVPLKFFRKQIGKPDAYTKLRVSNTHTFRMDPADQQRQTEQLEQVMRRTLEDGEFDAVELVAPPPSGGSVPVSDVLRIYRLVRSLGHEAILFDSAALPLAGG